jgi:hypothetical protein
MTRVRTHWGWLAAVALLATTASCAKQETVLLIEVAGPASITPSQLDVTVTAGLDTRAFMVPPTPEPAGSEITLPASFTISLDSSRMGPITVSIDALDVDQSPVGYGTTMMQHIVIGGQTVIEVMLSDQLPQQGADAGADADGATDGAAGVDAADGMGLDTATD